MLKTSPLAVCGGRRAIEGILVMCCIVLSSCGADDDWRGTGLIDRGQWVLVIRDSNGQAVREAQLTLIPQSGVSKPPRQGDVLPFKEYNGPGSLKADASGRILLVLPHDVKFGTDKDTPELDNRIRIESPGYAVVEFSFLDIAYKGIGSPLPVPTDLKLDPALPVSCYQIEMKPLPKTTP